MIYIIFFWSCRIEIPFPLLLTHLSTAFSITTFWTIFLRSPVWSCSLRPCFEKCHVVDILIHVSGLRKGAFKVDTLYISKQNSVSFSERRGNNFSMTGLIKMSYPRLLLSHSLVIGTINFSITKNILFQKKFISWSMHSLVFFQNIYSMKETDLH